MPTENKPSIPLLGALCVTEGVISQMQLDSCLQLQYNNPTTPIGQIMRQQGHISEIDLARMVARQNAFRRALIQGVERQLSARVLLNPYDDASSMRTIRELGLFAATEIDQSGIFGRNSQT